MSTEHLVSPATGAREEAAAAPPPAGADVEWDEAHPVLLPWRRNVGAPVVLDLAPPLERRPVGVDVVCWNLGIGLGRLELLLERLRSGSPAVAATAARPLVILAQEAYRADATVPPLAIGRFHGGRLRGAGRTDIAELAREHGLSLRYAPSMRNGMQPSDRGNAVLASCAIDSTYAFSLPFLRQRRVAVAVELAGLPRLAFVSAHLENRSRLVWGIRSAIGFGTSRARQAEALGRRIIATEGGDVVLGADLNTPRGTRDAAYQSLMRAGFQPARPRGRWGHTYHGVLPWFRLPLDHVLVHGGGGPVAEVTVERIDEDPADRRRPIFGSDHHPLLARVELGPAGRARRGDESAGR